MRTIVITLCFFSIILQVSSQMVFSGTTPVASDEPPTTVSAIPINVGGYDGWSSNVSRWSQDMTFHINDVLGFVYDVEKQDLLEVTSTSFDTCDARLPIWNYTTNGREIVKLDVPHDRYFISSKGCNNGVKLHVHLNTTERPSSKSHCMTVVRSNLEIPTLVAIAAIWDSVFFNI